MWWILDEMLPKLDGYGFLKKIDRSSCGGIIMLTAKSDIVDKILGLELGADDYMTKPFDMRELLARVRTLLRRMHSESTCSARSGDISAGGLEVSVSKRKAVVDGIALDLTPKEFDLLVFLLSSTGVVFSRESLLDSIWGMDYFGGTRTVDIHIQRLRKKLGLQHQELIQTVYGIGYYAGGE